MGMHGSCVPLGLICFVAAVVFLPQSVHSVHYWRTDDPWWPEDSLFFPLLASMESMAGVVSPPGHSGPVTIPMFGSGNVPCVHGGKSLDGTCVCPAPANYSGMACQLCQRNEACGAPYKECIQSLVIRGAKKHIECSLRSDFFIERLGGGRPIEANVTFDCDTEGGGPFSKGEKGRCALALYRVEPHREYTDAFFRCSVSRCSMHQGTAENTDNVSRMPKFYKMVQQVGQILIIILCVLFVVLRCVSSKLGRQRVGKIVITLAALLLISTLIFNCIMFVGMRLKPLDKVVVYTCKQTTCACEENPPPQYKPFCSSSALAKILPHIRNGIRFSCNLQSSMCQLTLSDLALVFDLKCRGSECLDTKRYPQVPQENTEVAQQNLSVLLSIAVVVVSFAIGWHAVWLSYRTRNRSLEFIRIFGLVESPFVTISSFHQGDAEPEINVDVSGDPAGRTEVHLSCETDGDSRKGRLHKNDNVNDKSVDSIRGEEEVVGLVSTRQDTSSNAQHVVHRAQDGVDHIELARRLAHSSFELTLTDLRYTLVGSRLATHEEAHTRIILHQVNFTVHSGEVLAIMGPSGAGKTSLLDLLSARNKRGRTTGSMSFNGTQVGASSPRLLQQYRNIIGYVSQEDTLLPALTVHQTIEYAARLKLPKAFSNTTIKNIVQHMIEAFRLRRCEHTIIGDGSSMRGVSGGEKRRVSIAVELLANPRILFLDEPTSGLDAVSAKRVMEVVVELAKDSPMRAYAPHYFAFRPIVVFSIHQPSQEIFGLFDKLLLLSHGVSVYCGPAHAAAQLLEERVTRSIGSVRPIPCRADHANHAEYLMKLEEVLDDLARTELHAEDLRPHRSDISPSLYDNDAHGVAGEDILRAAAACRKYYANVYQQIGLLTARATSCLLSSFHLVVCHAGVTAGVASLMMLLYREQNLDLPGSLNRAGSITFLLLVVSLVSLSCLEQLVVERKLYVVERENGFYRSLPYLISKVAVDILPLRVLPSLVLSSLIYFPMGLRVDEGMHFFWFVIIIIIFSVCITLLIFCIGIITGSFGAAALLSSVVILWNFVFGGLLVQSETVPSILQPFQKLSPFFLAFEALLANELDGQACTFAPTDETGKAIETSIPIMCVQYLSNIGLKPMRFNGDVALLSGYTMLLLVLAWILLSKFITIVR